MGWGLYRTSMLGLVWLPISWGLAAPFWAPFSLSWVSYNILPEPRVILGDWTHNLPTGRRTHWALSDRVLLFKIGFRDLPAVLPTSPADSQILLRQTRLSLTESLHQLRGSRPQRLQKPGLWCGPGISRYIILVNHKGLPCTSLLFCGHSIRILSQNLGWKCPRRRGPWRAKDNLIPSTAQSVVPALK